MNILVTGGAGFIGSYICKALLKKGHHVMVLDNLDPQIHGEHAQWPYYMPEGTENYIGDVRDRELVRQLLAKSDAVIHLAAAVGVGQSMYKIEHYCSVSVMGTAILLEEIIPIREKIRKIIVASSMSIYGEGLYRKKSGELVMNPSTRPLAQMEAGNWELQGDNHEELIPVPVTEDKPLKPESIYAVNKRDQEEMVLAFGKAYKIPSVAFRMFNVYGAYQALNNPYTGVAAIFSNKLLNDEQPMVFEDGKQRRDFVHVEDVANAYALAIENNGGDGLAMNLGSGRSISISEIATCLAAILGKEIKPIVTHKFRDGDIRNCFADISLIKSKLGWEPKWEFEEGVKTMTDWLISEKDNAQKTDSVEELKKMGLLK
ncbi:MAG: NAD-dependent epimerase/dehydratase family protein [Bacteroidota bacterium]|jgi:dTDP-L-rhamnose 4-epimerase|nr:GDP-mannose 4,6-dehydratase [Sphingobacteriales bacterium]